MTRSPEPVTVRLAPIDGGVAALAPAKVNLGLRVLGKRPDGYHDIDTLMVAIDLFDRLEFRPIDGAAADSTLEVSGKAAPSGEDNLCMRALKAFLVAARIDRAHAVRLHKTIPIGAGLGGGSSDAAATLLALDALWPGRVEATDLHVLAATLGSDVAFFLCAGAARCTGRGEVVTPLAGLLELDGILLFPGLSVSTVKVYEYSTKSLHSGVNPGILLLKLKGHGVWVGRLASRREGGSEAVRLFPEPKRSETEARFDRSPADPVHSKSWPEGRACIDVANDLEAAACRAEPRLEPLRAQLEALDLGTVIFSGSGSAYFVAGAPQSALDRVRRAVGGEAWFVSSMIDPDNDLVQPALVHSSPHRP